MYWNDGLGWGGWILMTLVMLAFWALVIFGIVAVFRGLSGNGQSATPRQDRDPQRILDERFARGEIDADEYHARQQVLRTANDAHRTHTPT
jgi:putative membrane protein